MPQMYVTIMVTLLKISRCILPSLSAANTLRLCRRGIVEFYVSKCACWIVRKIISFLVEFTRILVPLEFVFFLRRVRSLRIFLNVSEIRSRASFQPRLALWLPLLLNRLSLIFIFLNSLTCYIIPTATTLEAWPIFFFFEKNSSNFFVKIHHIFNFNFLTKIIKFFWITHNYVNSYINGENVSGICVLEKSFRCEIFIWLAAFRYCQSNRKHSTWPANMKRPPFISIMNHSSVVSWR